MKIKVAVVVLFVVWKGLMVCGDGKSQYLCGSVGCCGAKGRATVVMVFGVGDLINGTEGFVSLRC